MTETEVQQVECREVQIQKKKIQKGDKDKKIKKNEKIAIKNKICKICEAQKKGTRKPEICEVTMRLCKAALSKKQ